MHYTHYNALHCIRQESRYILFDIPTLHDWLLNTFIPPTSHYCLLLFVIVKTLDRPCLLRMALAMAMAMAMTMTLALAIAMAMATR